MMREREYCNQILSSKNKNIKFVSFQSKSELLSIDKEAFSHSTLEKISIPISIEKLEGGWNYKATKLTQISLSKYNKNYMFQNENFIVSLHTDRILHLCLYLK